MAYLIGKKNQIGQRKEMCLVTGIAEGTARDAIRLLARHKFTTKPKKFHQGRFQGFSYSIDQALCDRFLKERWNQPSNQPTGQSALQLADRPTCSPAVPFSSSSLLDNTTTEIDIGAVLNNDPDLEYWQKRNLSPTQAEDWAKELKMSPVIILESLRHCAFEMLQNEKDKPENYFYAVIKKARNYARPAGFKSHLEKQNEIEQKILTEKEQAAKKSQELYNRRQQAERDKIFWDMMNDPDGDLYKQCLEQMSKFDKKRFSNPIKRTGQTFENAIRLTFEKIVDEDA